MECLNTASFELFDRSLAIKHFTALIVCSCSFKIQHSVAYIAVNLGYKSAHPWAPIILALSSLFENSIAFSLILQMTWTCGVFQFVYMSSIVAETKLFQNQLSVPPLIAHFKACLVLCKWKITARLLVLKCCRYCSASVDCCFYHCLRMLGNVSVNNLGQTYGVKLPHLRIWFPVPNKCPFSGVKIKHGGRGGHRLIMTVFPWSTSGTSLDHIFYF